MLKILKRTQELLIMEYGPFSYIVRPDQKFTLLTKDLPKDLEELWGKMDGHKFYYCFSDEYLNSYNEGDWGIKDKSTVDTIEALEKGEYHKLFRHALWDGFLYDLNGNKAVRKIECNFSSENFKLDELKKALEKRTDWFDTKIVRVPSYGGCCEYEEFETKLIAKHLPTQQQFEQLQQVSLSPSYYEYNIQKYGYIKEFRR